MDQSTAAIVSSLHHHPALLYVGSSAQMVKLTIEHLQKICCPQGGCYVCLTCRNIAQFQHHNICWLSTEKNYTLEDIQVIQNTLSFALESGKHFFFVIKHAERLSTIVANSLLKSLEEPPAGYHFLLLTEKLDTILPTIRSRCIIFSHQQTIKKNDTHPLFYFFTATNPDALNFLQTLDSIDISEHEIQQVCDQWLLYWIDQYKQHLYHQGKEKQTKKIINVLTDAFQTLPMPGSGKIFLKNLFLNYKKSVS